MKLSNRYRPWEGCASQDWERLAHVMLDVPGKRLLATDNQIAVVIPCEPSDKDVSGLISVASLKWCHEHAWGEDLVIDCEHEDTIAGYGAVFDRPQVDGFPPIDTVLPELPDGETVTISFNAELLERAAKIIGQKWPLNVTFEFHPGTQPAPARIRPYERPGDAAFAVVMPLKPEKK